MGCAGEARPSGPPVLAGHVDDWRDRFLYQVVVDRFANGDPDNDALEGVGTEPGDLTRHQGGDFRGVEARLPYIERLGATALWISPVVRNVDRTEREDGYHGYWASDFTEVNPRFGDLEDLRSLVRAAHRRGMAVIVDIVTNHTGRVFSYDLDGNGVATVDEIEPPFAPDGPYEVPLVWHVPPPRLWAPGGEVLTLGPEHFRRRGYGDLSDPFQKELGDFPTGLRDLATDRSDVFDALVETYVRWVELTDIDGFRIDAVPHVERAFWPAFCSAVRARLAALGKPRFLMIGEVFTPNPGEIAPYTEDGGIDSFFDLPFKFAVIDGVLLDGRAPSGARFALEEAAGLFPASAPSDGVGVDPWRVRVALADNHDTWRLRGELDLPEAAELALTAVFTVGGLPIVYYGTEQGLDGMGGGGSREPLWETGFATDHRTYRHIQRLAAVREGSLALRRGDLVVRYASEHDGRSTEADAGLLAWERVADGDRALVALNAHATRRAAARVPTGFAPTTRLEDALAEAEPLGVVVDGDGSVTLSLAPRQGVVLLAARARR